MAIALNKPHIRKKLKKKDSWFFNVLSSIGNGVIVADESGKVVFMNEAAMHMTGCTESDAIGLPINRVLPFIRDTGCRPIFPWIRKDHQKNREIRSDPPVFFIRKNGESIPVDVLVSPIPGESDEAAGAVIVLRDMSPRMRLEQEQHQAEIKLIKSEFLYRYLFEESSIISLIIDRSGIIEEVNKASMEKFGYSKEELIGKPILDFVVPSFHEKVIINLERNLKGQEPLQHTDYYAIYNKQGMVHNVLFSAAKVIYDYRGQADCILITGIDNTERRAAEEELERSREQLRHLTQHLQMVREQERIGIAREIHDELGQTVTALKMDLAWLQRVVHIGSGVDSKIKTMIQLTDTTLQSMKRIASALRPWLLDDLGLIPAMEWQTHEFQERTGIHCRFIVPKSGIALDRDRSTAIFRIFQETLTNIARHAGATRAIIRLHLKDGHLTLTVKDNGRGIMPAQADHPRSFGIIGMRERVRPWGGEVILKGLPGRGTTVVVRVLVDGAYSDPDEGQIPW